MADIIASVEPQQMVISRSGSTRMPWVRSNFSTMASRSGFRAPGDGVLIDVVGNGLAGGFLDFGGRRKIRKSLREIHCVVFQGETGHLADDGLRELFGLGGEHSAAESGAMVVSGVVMGLVER